MSISRLLKSMLSIALLFIISVTTHAQVKFVNEFLNIGVGARSHGMFGAVTASENAATSAYWNPAGLIGLEAPFQLNAMHANWFGGLSNYDYASIAKNLNSERKAVGAISIIRMSVDAIPNTLQLIGPDGSFNYDRITEFSASDYAFLFSYGRALNESGSFSGGANVKIIHRSIGDFGKAWGFGADLGVKWKKSNYAVSLMARDITTTFNTWSFNLSDEDKAVFQKTGNEIPVSSTEINLPRLVAGFAYFNTTKNFSYLFESDLNISTNGTKSGIISSKNLAIDPSFGLELGYINKVFLRAGWGNIQRVINPENTENTKTEFQPNIGLGLVLGRLRIDYALANVGSVSGVLSSHIFSVSLDFVKRKNPS